MLEFKLWINEVHPYIKFDFKFSNKEINFLDTVLHKTQTSKLGTKLYTKDIYWQAYLHSKSKHPDSLKHSIPFEETYKGFQLNCYERGYKELEINAKNTNFRQKRVLEELNSLWCKSIVNNTEQKNSKKKMGHFTKSFSKSGNLCCK